MEYFDHFLFNTNPIIDTRLRIKVIKEGVE
jgi:hypothetical protein